MDAKSIKHSKYVILTMGIYRLVMILPQYTLELKMGRTIVRQ